MSSVPTDLRYTKDHAWVRARENVLTVGITASAADQIGAIGFVELPYPGELSRPGSFLGRMSSDTATATISMPFIAQINAVNEALSESPGLINSDPYGEGWIVVLEPGDPDEIDGLMDAADYEAFLSASDESPSPPSAPS